MNELHPSLGGWVPRFFPVAGDTGADHIFPGMFTPQVAGYHVVQGKLPGFPPTVLADEAVPAEHLEPGKPPLAPGVFYHICHPDNRGKGKGDQGSSDPPATILQHLDLAPEQQRQGPAGRANVERLVILIEHQYRSVDQQSTAIIAQGPAIVQHRGRRLTEVTGICYN